MKPPTSYFLAGSLAAASLAFGPAVAGAQTYPARPIRMVVPFPPGAASDFLARTLGQKLSELYGHQIVVDNRPGAGGLIGSQLIAKATADGYTVGMIGQPHLSNALMREPRPYDPLREFASVAPVASIPNVLVFGNNVPFKNVTELIAMAKAKPGAFNFGSAGVGSSSHLAGELFINTAGIKAVHVPFKSLGDIFAEMIAGRVHFYVFPLPAVMPMLKEGRLRAAAVATAKRAAGLPDVPTMGEAGFGQYQSESWFGLVAPAGVPAQVVAKLNADIVKVLREADTRERFQRGGAEPVAGSATDFHRLQSEEYTRLAKLIKDIGMKPL